MEHVNDATPNEENGTDNMQVISLNETQIEEEVAQQETQATNSFTQELIAHWRSEIWQVALLSWPMIISNVCSSLVMTTDIAFVGHLGKDYLAASSLGTAFYNALGFIPVGVLSAQDTLVSQAHGAKNERLKRYILFRSLFAVLLISIPIFFCFVFSKQLLILLGQDPEIAVLTSQFVKINAVGFIPYVLMRMLSRYLVTQSRVYFPLVVGVVSVLANALLNFLFVNGIGYKGLGFIGAPIATVLTRTLCATLYVAYTIYIERRKTVEDDESDGDEESESTLEVLKQVVKNTVKIRGLIEYFKLGVPGCIMICLEIWGFEATALLAGLFKNPKYLAAHSVVFNITIVTFMLPLSISIACSIRVGVNIGAKNAMRAKVVTMISFWLAVLVMTITALLMFVLRKQLGKIFTNDAEVLAICAVVIPIGALFQIFDGIQASMAGILRGLGKQYVGAITNFISYYVLGLPVGSLLAFYFKMNLRGLWLGLALGLSATACMQTLFIAFGLDYQKEVEKATIRMALSDVKKAAAEIETDGINNKEEEDNETIELSDYANLREEEEEEEPTSNVKL